MNWLVGYYKLVWSLNWEMAYGKEYLYDCMIIKLFSTEIRSSV